LKNLLTRNRIALNKDLTTIEQRRKFSPALMAMSKALDPILRENVNGRFLDIGCGEVPFRRVILDHVEEYMTFDIEERTERLDYIGNIQNMDMIPGDSFDSAGCFGVLEHVSEPARAAKEIARILKPGGVAVITAPFMARLHEEPHDYYRFTGYGLKYLFEEAGLEVRTVVPYGGIFSFLGHQLSTLLVCSVWHLPLIRQVVFTLNHYIVVKSCVFLDRLLRTSRILPIAFLGVFVKQGTNPGEEAAAATGGAA
jgi:SAM-dependent methyltransferase